jgi:hypothetical protein
MSSDKEKESNMNANTNINTLTVDTLGGLLAQIAELTKQADVIKDFLKNQATAPNGSKVFEGALFKSTVIESNRSVVDYKALLASLNVAADVVAQFTKTTAVFSVKTTSK